MPELEASHANGAPQPAFDGRLGIARAGRLLVASELVEAGITSSPLSPGPASVRRANDARQAVPADASTAVIALNYR